jgi:outer membrane receptor protein involved in Fe transport
MFKRILLCAALAAPLFAHAAEGEQAVQQSGATNGSISGEIRDALGRAIDGASVTLKSADGTALGITTSDASGHFVFTGISQGSYAVQAEKTGFQLEVSIVTVAAGKGASTTVTLAAQDALQIQVAAERLAQARNGLSPKTGGSLYSITADDINNLPMGDSTPINQVLLQAPGVVNDQYSQLHIRGDHNNIQYRINGVILPEGVDGFGLSMDSHFADKIDLMTGALPAQYGYRTAGVIEITTKTQYEAGGKVDMYAGSNQTYNPSFEYGNTKGNFSYFVNGSYLTNNVGIENPTSSVNPIHDATEQLKGFGYLSWLLDSSTKASILFGSYDGKFQIPDNPGQPTYAINNGPPPLTYGGLLPVTYDSSTLNDRQKEVNRFAVFTLQRSPSEIIDYQVSLFTRYSSVHYVPDIAGNMAFNGVASDLFRSSFITGLQADGSYRLNETHTLRSGLFLSNENVVSDNISTVINLANAPTYSQETIVDDNSKNGNTLMGVYLQDEWKATDKLTVNYGGRFDQVNAYVDEHQLSPRLGLVYKASDETTWHTGFARYFTPPPTELVSSTDLNLFNNTTAAQSPLNSPVKSERGSYLDAGVTHQLTTATSLGLDSYYKQTRNLIDEGQFGPAPILTPFNYDQGKLYGVELTGNYKSGDFSSYANLARNVSRGKEVVSGQYLWDPTELAYAANNWVHVDHEQALTASVGGSYLVSGTRLNSDLIFQSGLRNGFANTTSLPSYTVLNLGAARKIDFSGAGPVEARLAVNNLFDRIYEIRDGSGIGVAAPSYGPRRGLFLGLSKPL